MSEAREAGPTGGTPAVRVYPVAGLPEVRPGDDLAALLGGALAGRVLPPAEEAPPDAGDALVVAQKVVSKAEGSWVALEAVQPGPFARQWAQQWGRDPRLVELVLRESRRIVRMERGVIIAETHHGFICANAGVDLSNTGVAPEAGGEVAVLLPEDPDRSAALLREGLARHLGVTAGAAPAVIVADTFGRPWRVGLTQVALGTAGLAPLLDLREGLDADGRPLHATVIAVADQIACAADLVCGKTARVPAALVRGAAPQPPAPGNADGRALLREPGMDLFR